MSEMLFNRELIKDIMLTGVRILRDNYFYDYETAQIFGDAFVTNINKAHMFYVMNWTDLQKEYIHKWKGAKEQFTFRNATVELFGTLRGHMNFNDEEIQQFQNIFTKYVNRIEPHEYAEDKGRASN